MLRNVFGMHDASPLCVSSFGSVETCIPIPSLVNVVNRPFRGSRPQHLRDGIRQSSVLPRMFVEFSRESDDSAVSLRQFPIEATNLFERPQNLLILLLDLLKIG